MSNHVIEWLNAYLDGELKGGRLHQVQKHLTECSECREELESLQGLSALLKETAATDEFISAERFASNVTLKLPRGPEHSPRRSALEIAWWMTPVGILAVWFFIQVTFALSRLVLTASDAGLLGNAFSLFQGIQPQTEWFGTVTSWLGGQLGSGQMILSALNNIDLYLRNLVGSFIWQALLAVIYLIWLASWWFRQQNQSSNLESAEFSS
jgi:predicted anti-sigma-YlaC factor YlaD